MGDALLDEGFVALSASDWGTARARFEEALAAEESPEARDGLGQAKWWMGARVEALEDRSRAYVLYRRRGDHIAAARLAGYLAAEARIDGNPSASQGWFARAEGLLADQPTSLAHGWLEVERAKRAGDPDQKRAHAERAVALGRELGVADIEVMGLAQLGLAHISAGAYEQGLCVLDEAMAAAMAGEPDDPLAVGDTCCTTLSACERLDDYRRAVDWCRVVLDFAHRRKFVPLAPWCRSVYAGVLISTGKWERAEQELKHSLHEYEVIDSPARVFAVVRLAALRIHQGRFGEADALLAGYEQHPLALEPTVERLIDQGDTAAALAVANRRLATVEADPISTAAALLVVCDACLAAGDLTAVAEHVERLEALTGPIRERLAGRTALIRGRLCLARGQRADATRAFVSAADVFERLGMPLEHGRALVGSARSREASEAALSVIDARHARDIFERLGARPDADAAAALLRSFGVSGRSAPKTSAALTSREREVLALLAEGVSNAEIARRLVISPKTAEHHTSRVLRKLGLQSRAEAAAAVARGV
jgi:DNA-binding NarL/FixJ family response regulator